jgi:hypothetical protein
VKRRPWDPEAHAAEIFAALLGGVVDPLDPGGGAEQLHDFDLSLPDGATIAVEVTRHNTPSSLAVLAELDQRDWHFQGIRHVWVVDMIPSYNVAAVHDEIVDLLVELEAAEIHTLHLRPELFDETLTDDELDDKDQPDRALLDKRGVREAAKRLRDLGARLVYELADASQGRGEVIMGEAPQAGSTGPSIVVELIERHAGRPDNAAKLAAASDRSERHLFVWVETSQQAAVAAFGFSAILPDGAGMPDQAPALPGCVDAVWAVTAYDNAHIWQYHRQHGWPDFGTWRRPD